MESKNQVKSTDLQLDENDIQMNKLPIPLGQFKESLTDIQTQANGFINLDHFDTEIEVDMLV